MGKVYVEVVDAARAAWWQKAIGTTRVAVESAMPVYAHIPAAMAATEQRVKRLIYKLDLRALTADQVLGLVAALAETFGAPREEVVAELAARGLPVMADGCLPIGAGHTGGAA